MRQVYLTVVMAFVTSVVWAADRTWNGGGADNNWSNATNWNGTVPAAGDTLFFGGSTRLNNNNDLLAGTAFKGVVFSNAASSFTLAGNGITLDGNVSNLSASGQSVNFPMALSATRAVYGSNASAYVRGVLSGPGGLIAAVTNNTLFLTGNNTYAGVTTVTNGCRLYLTHGNALGNTQAETRVYGRANSSLYLNGGITVAEPITIIGQIPPWLPCLSGGAGTNVISGLVSKELEMRVGVENWAGVTNVLIFAGGIRHVSSGTMALNPSEGAQLIITGKPIEFGLNAEVLTENPGTVIFAVAGNTFSRLRTGNQSKVRLDVANALPANAELWVGLSWAQNGFIDLNGFDQTVAYLRTDGLTAGDPGYLAVTSAAPATLTLNQNAGSVFVGALAGAVRLVKNGSGTITFTNVVSTTTGDIVVNAGSVAVAETGGFGASANIRVNGGTLNLRNSASLPDVTALRVAYGAKVSLKAGVSETVGTLFLDGEQQSVGTYGATDSGAAYVNNDFFAGSGVVSVATGPVTSYADALWDAGGADVNMSTAANWAGDAVPAYDGYTRATFAAGGSTATVDEAFSFFRMAFNANTNFTVAAGGGVITNGAGGVRAGVPNATSRTYTLAADIVLGAEQSWIITNSGAGVATLNVTGTIADSGADFDLTKRGVGELILSGNNTYSGKTTVQTNVLVIKHGNALGSVAGMTDIQDGGYIRIDGGSGITVDERLTMTGDQSLSYAGTLRSNTGSNIWSGKITSNGRLRCEGGAKLEITGGVDGNGLVCSAYAPGYIRFTEKPITCTALTSHTGGGGVILAVGGNTFTTFAACGDFVRIDVPNAWLPTVSLIQGNGGNTGSRLNLNGNDQTVGEWKTDAADAQLRILYSVAPATLTVSQSASSLFNGSVTGAVSIVKLGTGNLTLTNAFISTSGSFAVSNGTLTVSNKGTFGPNCANVYVGGSGTLLLSNSVVIANSAKVRMPAAGTSTAKISLASGVNETVGWLSYGDSIRRAGSYGSSSSDAAVKDDTHFAGAGILTVLHDRSGTLITMR